MIFCQASPLGLADDALMIEHGWPLNDRELKLALHRAVLLAPSPLVTAADLRAGGFAAPPRYPSRDTPPLRPRPGAPRLAGAARGLRGSLSGPWARRGVA